MSYTPTKIVYRQYVVEGLLADIDGVRYGQVCLEDGLIAGVGPKLGIADIVYPASCVIFAGMGDVHIHARQDVSGAHNYKETFATAAAAALNGGVVHVADMPNNPVAPIDDASYAAKEKLVLNQNLLVPITLYAGIGPGTKPLNRDVPYKAYMGPSVGELFFRSQAELDETLQRYVGRAVSFHCEDPDQLTISKGNKTHEQRRPPSCELVATDFALRMVEKHHLRGKLCHYSVGDGLQRIMDAKIRSYVRHHYKEASSDMQRWSVTAEVTPHHIFFDTTHITDSNHHLMQMNPPLRSAADRMAMIEALRVGIIDYLATDHAPHTMEEKIAGISGQSHLDTYGAFVTWLIKECGFSLERIAAICSANPGSFVSPYNEVKYGRLQHGYAGALTVLDLNTHTHVNKQMLRTKCGWSPFEGITFPGCVHDVVISRRSQ